MADKSLEVNVNVGGKDNLSPALERQKKLIGDLAAAEANLTKLRKDYGAGGAELILADLRQQLAAERAITQEVQKRMTITRPPAPGEEQGQPAAVLQRPPPGGPPDLPSPGGEAATRAGSPPWALMTPEPEAVSRAGRPSARLAGIEPSPSAATPGAQLSEARQVAMQEVQIKKAAAEEERQRQRQAIYEQAHLNATGRFPGQAATVGGSRWDSVAAGASRVGRTAGALSAGDAAGAMGGILGALPGPLGAIGAAVVPVITLVAQLAEAFRGFRPTLAEVLGEMRHAEGATGRSRQTGLASTEDLREALTPNNLRILGERQRAGNVAGARSLINATLNLREGQLQELQSVDFAGAQADVRNTLTRRMARRRSGTVEAADLSIEESNERAELIARMTARGIRAADMPEELRGSWAGMTPERIRELTRAVAAPLTQAQSAVETLRAADRTGVIPSLRPGTLTLNDLPSIFRSEQRDYLGLHDQVQQEVVRDQREQARFEAQMDLWRRVLRQLEMNNLPMPAGGWELP